MNRNGLIVFIVLTTLALYIMITANPYRSFGLLSKFDTNHYTIHITSKGTTEVIIRDGNYYYYSSAGTQYNITGAVRVEEYTVIGMTTSVRRAFLRRPFSGCNFVDPLLSGRIIWPTRTYIEETINMGGLYVYGCYVFSPMYGTGVITVTITDNTMIGRIPDYGITFTLIA